MSRIRIPLLPSITTRRSAQTHIGILGNHPLPPGINSIIHDFGVAAVSVVQYNLLYKTLSPIKRDWIQYHTMNHFNALAEKAGMEWHLPAMLPEPESQSQHNLRVHFVTESYPAQKNFYKLPCVFFPPFLKSISQINNSNCWPSKPP